jgi:hypothetical protein
MNDIVASKTTVVNKIERVIQLHIAITLRNADALACLNNDWMHLTDDELRYFIKMREEYEENFRKIISKGVLDGEIKSINQEVVVFSILSTLRTIYLWYDKTKSLDAKTLQNTIATVFLTGVKKV